VATWSPRETNETAYPIERTLERMAASVDEEIAAAVGGGSGPYPGQRIATTKATTDSPSTTTEIVVDSVTAPLVAGRTYMVSYMATVQGVAGDAARSFLRENNLAGAELWNARVHIAGTGSQGWPLWMTCEYTAVSTASKTFVATLTRGFGSESVMALGAANRPRFLYVDFAY